MNSLYWFRTDLRLQDNHALNCAMQASEHLIALYIITPETWRAHDYASCKVAFILENLKTLSDDLSARGIPLLIRTVPTFNDSVDVIDNLIETHDIKALFFNREYAFDERQRDKRVQDKYKDSVQLEMFDECVLMPPGTVLSQQEKPLQVFTPFKKKLISIAESDHAWCETTLIDKQFKALCKPDSIPKTVDGFETTLDLKNWPAGETAAHKRLNIFCEAKIHDYQENRDFPDLHGTSQLSPYLSIGVVSPRQCITAAVQSAEGNTLSDVQPKSGAEVWISEVIWREFYQHIMYFNETVCKHNPFKPNTDKLPWSYDDTVLTAWQTGQTGFPFVDAGMRQLNQTGWLHNRMRMVVAMFLSKLLFLDWRLGEKYFMEHLIDGDFASNNGGWQWCASTGTDAAPYFRIFNPITQSERFDPAGAYIKQYCPELAALDKHTIHDPYARGIKPGTLDYPMPIIDYKKMRAATIAHFKALE